MTKLILIILLFHIYTLVFTQPQMDRDLFTLQPPPLPLDAPIVKPTHTYMKDKHLFVDTNGQKKYSVLIVEEKWVKGDDNVLVARQETNKIVFNIIPVE